MSTNATDEENEAAENGPSPDGMTRYAGLTIGDEEFVVYDRENHAAWIQSTVAVDVGSER